MNKDFSESKFSTFTSEKQFRVLFELASFIEANRFSETSSHFQKLYRYHSFLKNSEDKNIQKLNKEFNKIKVIDYQFQIYLMNLERLLGQSKKEYDFLINKNDSNQKQKVFPIVCVLDSIRSAHNIGAFFRNADCFGVEKIFLCGLSPQADHGQVLKTAMGTETLTDSSYHQSAIECVLELKKESYRIIAVETAKNAIPLSKYKVNHEKLALLFGHEQFGLSLELLKMSDEIINIELYGHKNSLNVAVCQAIVLNEMTRQLL